MALDASAWPLGTIAFLSVAAALGAGSGAVFALVALLAPANKVGSVTGVVGAAGGLGGFIPPLIMGWLHGKFGSYAIGLAALAVVAIGALAFTVTVVHRSVRAHRDQQATPLPISSRTVEEAPSIRPALRLSAEC